MYLYCDILRVPAIYWAAQAGDTGIFVAKPSVSSAWAAYDLQEAFRQLHCIMTCLGSLSWSYKGSMECK